MGKYVKNLSNLLFILLLFISFHCSSNKDTTTPTSDVDFAPIVQSFTDPTSSQVGEKVTYEARAYDPDRLKISFHFVYR